MTLCRAPDEEGNRCEACNGNGKKGRVGIYEVIPIRDTLRELIAARAPMTEVKAAARAEGVKFLADSAREKLNEGVTSLDEVSEYVKVDT
jgi:type II secretory ATPase GspE/PulE/Tfp pilus assembly ATPase PilB-like protein